MWPSGPWAGGGAQGRFVRPGPGVRGAGTGGPVSLGLQSVKGGCFLSLPDFGVGVGGSGGGMGTPTSACHAKGREMGSSDVAPLGAGTWVSQ